MSARTCYVCDSDMTCHEISRQNGTWVAVFRCPECHVAQEIPACYEVVSPPGVIIHIPYIRVRFVASPLPTDPFYIETTPPAVVSTGECTVYPPLEGYSDKVFHVCDEHGLIILHWKEESRRVSAPQTAKTRPSQCEPDGINPRYFGPFR